MPTIISQPDTSIGNTHDVSAASTSTSTSARSTPLPLLNAANAANAAGRDAPYGFTADEMFVRRASAHRDEADIDTSAHVASAAKTKAKHSLRARFVAAFVSASRKLMLDRVCFGWNKSQGGGDFNEDRRDAARLLKTSTLEITNILAALETPSHWRSNTKARLRSKHRLPDNIRQKHFQGGKLSIDQRMVLYSLPEIKRSLERADQDHGYSERRTGSSRRVMLDRAVKAVQALDDKAEMTAKLIIDVYMQRKTHGACAQEMKALLAPEVVGRMLEMTAGLTSDQRRAAVLDEIEEVCANLSRRASRGTSAAQADASATTQPGRYNHLQFAL